MLGRTYHRRYGLSVALGDPRRDLLAHRAFAGLRPRGQPEQPSRVGLSLA